MSAIHRLAALCGGLAIACGGILAAAPSASAAPAHAPAQDNIRSLDDILQPLLEAGVPLTTGAAQALQQGGADLSAAVEGVGNGVGDVVGHSTTGAGGTVAALPQALYSAIDKLENGDTILAFLLNHL